MPRRRVVGWSFAVTSRLFFQSRGPVEDDGNGRGLSLAGLGICGHQEALPVRRTSWEKRASAYRKTMTIEKFAFRSASDVQCRDRRRLDPSMRIVPEPIAQ